MSDHGDSTIEYFQPATLHGTGNSYSHAVAALNSGRTVHISGQVALDPAGTLVGLDDFREQATYSFINLGRALEASGAHYSDIVKLNYYLTDVSDIPVLREVRDTFIAADRRPASTAVQVAALFEAGLLIEIDATAVVTH